MKFLLLVCCLVGPAISITINVSPATHATSAQMKLFVAESLCIPVNPARYWRREIELFCDKNHKVNEALKLVDKRRTRGSHWRRSRVVKRHAAVWTVDVLGVWPILVETDWWQEGRLASFFTSYRPLNETLLFMEKMLELCGVRCAEVEVGTTQNGTAIRGIRLSGTAAAATGVWIDGGVHAREWISPMTTLYLLYKLVLSQHESWVRNHHWFLIPVLNPDGYEWSWRYWCTFGECQEGDGDPQRWTHRLWRKSRSNCPDDDVTTNCGIDANRCWVPRNMTNESFREMGKEFGYDKQNSQQFAGGNIGAEPICNSVQDYILKAGTRWSIYVTFHGYGRYIFSAGKNSLSKERYQANFKMAKAMDKAIRLRHRRYYYVGSSQALLYETMFTSDEWALQDGGFQYSFGIELPPRDCEIGKCDGQQQYNFHPPYNLIIQAGREMWTATEAMVQHKEKAGK